MKGENWNLMRHLFEKLINFVRALAIIAKPTAAGYIVYTYLQIIIVCGSNKKLYNELSKINNDKLIILGFVNNINDLHNENIGFNLKTNAPVIFDYAGYHCSLWFFLKNIL